MQAISSLKITAGKLSNPKLQSGLNAVFDASAAVQVYLSSILQQPDIKLNKPQDNMQTVGLNIFFLKLFIPLAT